MILRETAAKASAKLEYSACPVCGSEQRQFPFHLHEPYTVARCTACGFHYLYPGLIKTAMQEAYRRSTYYEGGACGYADTSYTAQESALRDTFERLLHNLVTHGDCCKPEGTII
jgi:DNA-directed RNA polymerase subunit RPC12/RpoP